MHKEKGKMIVKRASKEDIEKTFKQMSQKNLRLIGWTNTSKRFLKDEQNRLLLIGWKGKEFAGYIGLKMEQEVEKAGKFVDLKKAAHITWIAVLPKFRKEGVGSKLLKVCEPYIKQLKKKSIWLDCNKFVSHFYLKNGYKIVGKYSFEGKPLFVMEKRLK